MSPEQATGSGQIDGRSDIYSLGCVVYEMLTGSVPFTGLTAQAVMARHSVDIAPPIRSVRPTVTDALERAVLTALKRVRDRKSTRLNSSHTVISYAVFCLKKKKKHRER